MRIKYARVVEITIRYEMNGFVKTEKTKVDGDKLPDFVYNYPIIARIALPKELSKLDGNSPLTTIDMCNLVFQRRSVQPIMKQISENEVSCDEILIVYDFVEVSDGPGH